MKVVDFHPPLLLTVCRFLLPLLALFLGAAYAVTSPQPLKCTACFAIALLSGYWAIPKTTYRLTQTELQKIRDWTIPLADIQALDLKQGIFAKNLAVTVKNQDMPLYIFRKDINCSAAEFADQIIRRKS